MNQSAGKQLDTLVSKFKQAQREKALTENHVKLCQQEIIKLTSENTELKAVKKKIDSQINSIDSEIVNKEETLLLRKEELVNETNSKNESFTKLYDTERKHASLMDQILQLKKTFDNDMKNQLENYLKQRSKIIDSNI